MHSALTKSIFRCNVDRLNLLRGSLPLEGEWSEVWLKIDKVIDQLHIKNHKVCKSIENKNTIKCEHSHNTIILEGWLQGKICTRQSDCRLPGSQPYGVWANLLLARYLFGQQIKSIFYLFFKDALRKCWTVCLKLTFTSSCTVW